MSTRNLSDVHSQLAAAGLTPYLTSIDKEVEGATSVTGRLSVSAINRLLADERFAEGGLSALHQEVGKDRMDFRAHPGELGPGSLQIVIDKKTGRFNADIDHFNPYDGVGPFLAHSFGEVVPHFLRKLFKRKR